MGNIARTAAILTAAGMLAGCGTMVPGLQEFPNKPGDEQLLVASVVKSIHCEISNAVVDFINSDVNTETRNFGRRSAAWLDKWGAQVALTLAVEEKSALSPNAVGMPPSPATAVFMIGGNATLSADATRTDKLNFFFTVKDLYKRGRCDAGIQPPSGAPSLLIQSDLKLRSWLFDQILLSGTNEIVYATSASGVFKQNVLQHEVKFEAITSGGLNPSWKLVSATVDSSGTLLSASRDRTSDLIVTFGPLDPKQKNGGLSQEAETAHLVSQFGVTNATNGGSTITKLSIFP